MRRSLHVLLAGLFLLGRPAAAFEEGVQPSLSETAQAIRLFYESRLEELKPGYRGHWVLRLYRITGDARYLKDLRPYGEQLHSSFLSYAQGFKDPAFRALKNAELLGPVPLPEREKHVKRRQVLEAAGDYLYMHKLLYLTFMVQSVGLEKRDAAAYETALAALRDFPFRRFLLEPDLLRYNASEIANDIYYLQALGIENFENEFFQRFQSVHQNTDESGDPVLFENKIYGLTHLVIAATGYYQHPVPAEKFSWILDYFGGNADMILARLKPDVVAEVGLCFLLAGQPDHPLVARTRKFIAEAWDPASGMIPSVKGTFDLNKGEHRNVLAFMLLTGFEQLYPGPDLGGEQNPSSQG